MAFTGLTVLLVVALTFPGIFVSAVPLHLAHLGSIQYQDKQPALRVQEISMPAPQARLFHAQNALPERQLTAKLAPPLCLHAVNLRDVSTSS